MSNKSESDTLPNQDFSQFTADVFLNTKLTCLAELDYVEPGLI